MTALQKINQGTAPAGSDGDTVRSAFSKVNSNVDVLNTQAALTSSAVITAAQALTNAHVGRRVSVNLTTAGVINMPSAATCVADNVILLRNIGSTVATLAITTGSGDTVALSKLNPGETALMDTDGVHAWNVLMRGRTNSDNEVVNGSCTVGGALSVAGNETVGGTLVVGGAITASGGFSARPTFAGATPWDSANLNPVSITGSQTVTGAKTFSNTFTLSQAATVSPSLVLNANGYAPSLRSITSTFSTDFVNSAGTAVNFSVFDSGASSARVAFSVGDASNVDKVTVKNFGISQGNGVVFLPSSSANTPLLFGTYGGGVSGSVSVSGATTAFNTSSDYRLKQNYTVIENARASIRKIRFYTGEFRATPGEQHDYVIAHELQEIIPTAVTGEKDAMGDWHPVYRQGFNPTTQTLIDVQVGAGEDGEPIFEKQVVAVPTPVEPGDVIDVVQEIAPQAVDYSKLVPRIGAAVQEIDTDVEDIKGKFADLLLRVEALEGK